MSQLEHNTDTLDDNRDATSQMVDGDKAIELFREHGFEPTVRDLSEGSDEQVVDKVEQYLMKLKDWSRMETEEKSMMEATIGWAAEARREGKEQKRSKPEDRRKARKCVLEKRNSQRRRKRRVPTSWM